MRTALFDSFGAGQLQEGLFARPVRFKSSILVLIKKGDQIFECIQIIPQG